MKTHQKMLFKNCGPGGLLTPNIKGQIFGDI